MFWALVACAFAARLVSVVHLTRHGIRSPLIKYDWDTSPWNTNPGELTRDGIAQMNILGQEYRRRYIEIHKLISSKYNSSEVYIKSTDFDRTISSAKAMMAGFFPIGPDLISAQNKKSAVPPFKFGGLDEAVKNIGNEAIPSSFQPVYIDMVGRHYDYLLLGFSKVCPKITDYIMSFQNSDSYQKYKEWYERDIKANLESALKSESIDFEDAAMIGDTLETIVASGYALPGDIDDNLFSNLRNVRDYCNSYMFSSSITIALASSELFKYVISFFNDVISQKTAKKISFFFVHDTNFIAYLNFLRIWSPGNPPFASTLVFELYEDEEYYVEIKYNDELIAFANSEIKKISFNDFREICGLWVSKNIEEDCVDLNNMMRQYWENYFHTYVS